MLKASVKVHFPFQLTLPWKYVDATMILSHSSSDRWLRTLFTWIDSSSAALDKTLAAKLPKETTRKTTAVEETIAKCIQFILCLIVFHGFMLNDSVTSHWMSDNWFSGPLVLYYGADSSPVRNIFSQLTMSLVIGWKARYVLLIRYNNRVIHWLESFWKG